MKKIITLTALACAAAIATQADVLLTYDASVAANLYQNNAGHANVSGGDLAYTGATQGSWDQGGNPNGQVWGRPAWSSMDPEYTGPTDPIIAEYFTLTGTVAGLGAGETLDIDGIDMDWTVFNGGTKRNWYVDIYGSPSGFASTNDVLSKTYAWEAPTTWQDLAVDVSADTSYQGLVNDDTFEFRIYISGSDKQMSFDNINVTGTVIPEPATLGLVGAFGVGILFVRRRLML